MAITLGKDCAVSINGLVRSARSVTFTGTARTIEINEYGRREVTVYSTGHDYTVSIEFNDSDDMGFGPFEQGTVVTVSGGSAGWSFPAVITSVSETASVDGVATFTVEAKMSIAGIK